MIYPRAGDLDPPGVGFDYGFRQRQTQSGPLNAARASLVGALEALK